LLGEEKKVAVALSGGKDSLTLLYMLKAISGYGLPPFEIVAVHVAGEYTCGAGIGTGFLQAICKEMEIPLIVKESTKTLEELECYSCSRERRKLLFDAAKEAGAHTIAFGHHREDNSETLMMNLLQKGEFAGMLPKVAMQHYDVRIIRPLIYVNEEDIIQFAKQYNFMRITCQCPVGQNSNRKKVKQWIQEIESAFPHAKKNLASASLLYGSDKANTP